MAEEYPVIRNLDGVYYRVERNGQWHSIAFTDLTREEQERFLLTLSPKGIKEMVFIMADTVRHIGDQLDLVLEE